MTAGVDSTASSALIGRRYTKLTHYPKVPLRRTLRKVRYNDCYEGEREPDFRG